MFGNEQTISPYQIIICLYKSEYEADIKYVSFKKIS